MTPRNAYTIKEDDVSYDHQVKQFIRKRHVIEVAAKENEAMWQGSSPVDKVDLRARVYDTLRTRDAWTISDVAKRMRLKEGAAYQVLTELKRDGYLTVRQLHDELVYEHKDL